MSLEQSSASDKGSLIMKKDGFQIFKGVQPDTLHVMYLVGATCKKFGVVAQMKCFRALCSI